MSVIEKLASEGHLDEAQVDRIGRTVADMKKLAEEDPAAAAELHKLANMITGTAKATGEVMRNLVPNYIALQMITGATAGAAYAGKKIHDSINKAKEYKAMMQHNQDLGDFDSKRVQMTYNTLRKFNPEYASDPLVAGEFVRRSLEMSRMPMQEVNAIVAARKNMSSMQGRAPVTELLGNMSSLQSMGAAGAKAGHGQAMDALSLEGRQAQLAHNQKMWSAELEEAARTKNQKERAAIRNDQMQSARLRGQEGRNRLYEQQARSETGRSNYYEWLQDQPKGVPT